MNSVVLPSNSNRVLILGNGFDLDLGWNTKFSDYVKSKYWPKNAPPGSILSYLESCRNIADWFDLELEIGKFFSGSATRGDSKYVQEFNQKYFLKLVDGFKQYLIEATKEPVRQDSIAAIVLSAIMDNSNFSSIYSFNYTSLNDIANRLSLYASFNYEHVHGSIQNDDIIIGAPEDVDLNPGYEFLYKTFNEHYTSNSLIHDLRDAREVVFFGHSLGPTDYHYFREFFREQCREGLSRQETKKITIFTYDNASRLAILSQLRKMNEKRTNLLYNQNDFKIIITSNGMNTDVRAFLNHLDQTGSYKSAGVLPNLAVSF